MAGYMGEYLETRLEDFTEYDNTSDISRASTGSCTTDSSISSVPSSKHWTSRLERIPHYKYIRFQKPIDETYTLAIYGDEHTYMRRTRRQNICWTSMSDLLACMQWGLEDYKLKQEDKKIKHSSHKPTPKLPSKQYESDEFLPIMSAKMESLSLEDDCKAKLQSELDSLRVKANKKKDKNSRCREYYPIPPSCTNFLHIALLNLKPLYAEDPFIYFGIELRCVDGLEKIYDIEGLFKKDIVPKEHFHVGNKAKILVELITTAQQAYPYGECQNNSTPIIERIATSVSAFLNGNTENRRELDEKLEDDALDRFIYFFSNMRKSTEAQLHDFLEKFLLLDTETRPLARPCMRSLPQFKWVIKDHSVGQHCTADLEFFLKERKTTQLKFNKHSYCPIKIKVNEELLMDIEGDTLIDAKLFYQCWKQAFAAAMFPEHLEGPEKYVVLQGCTMVVGQWIKTCVLCIDQEDFTELKKIDNAMTMVEWIRNRGDKDGHAWCRFYVDTQKDHLLDVILLHKYVYTNFCKCVYRNS